jgi:electron-transferring-flavoprotein dehydrogenase
MPNEIDILVIGAGSAGLAAAIEAKRQAAAHGKQVSVVVLDKASRVGYHCLSGASFEAGCLDALVPGWRDDHSPFVHDMLKQEIKQHDTYFLLPKHALHIPFALVPGVSRHDRNHTISVASLSAWLAEKARAAGAEVYNGFSVKEPIIEQGAVKGAILHERGRDHDGTPMGNYLAEERIRAKVTIIADGVCGPIGRKVIGELGLAGKNPQVYSIASKQLLKLPGRDHKGPSRVVQTFGYPNRLDVFGGGFLYDMGVSEVSVGLVLGLDWKYYDLEPQQELELYKQHPLIAGLLGNAEIVTAGAKMIPEGGYYSMPRLHAPGVLLAGDAAGMVNMVKLKGIHLAIKSGMAAGRVAVDALISGDIAATSAYDGLLEQAGVLKEMRSARNMRQGFTTPFGSMLGAPLTMVQQFIPFRLPMKPDTPSTRHVSIKRKYGSTFDRKTFASRSGTMHDEKLLSHIRIPDDSVCRDCIESIGGPCTSFCPAEVYAFRDDRQGITVSSTDCVHCMTCSVKCPKSNIKWETPEGGFGPRYRRM